MSEEGIPRELRAQVGERAFGCCEYCKSQARFATQSFCVDHVVPRSKGGTATLDNLALACPGCNNHKFNKLQGLDPVTGQRASLFHPRLERWEDHFVWSDDCALILGLTATGRATVEELRLNREGLVNLRRALYRMGEHPAPAEVSPPA